MYTNEWHKDKNAKRKIKTHTKPAKTYGGSAYDDPHMTTTSTTVVCYYVAAAAATVHLRRYYIQICSPTHKAFN